MLKILIDEGETYNEETGEFKGGKEYTLLLEHSLISLSKWEAIWKKPFIPPHTPEGRKDHTAEESYSYFKCMAMRDYPEHVMRKAWVEKHRVIQEYISDEHTATKTYHDPRQKPSKTIVTSELIYYWMIMHNIPFECQKWHLNNLLTLIDVCNIKNGKQRKMSPEEIKSKNRELNRARRAKLDTKG